MRTSRAPLAVALATLALACAESPAQPPSDVTPTPSLQSAADGRPGGRGGTLAMREALGLSDRQVEEIRAIMAEAREASAPLVAELRAEGRGARRPRDRQAAQADARVQRLRDIQEDARERVQAVLTAQQRETAQELRQERMEQRRAQAGQRRGGPAGPRGAMGPGGGLLRLADRLELTDDQKAAIQAIHEELREKNAPILEALRASGERPFRRPPEGAEPDPRLAELRTNMEAAREATLAVLTGAQRATLEELRASLPERPRGDRPGGRRGGRRGGPGAGAGGPGGPEGGAGGG